MLREEAEAELANAKLDIQVIEVPSPDVLGTVVSQDLEPSTEVNQGTLITIEVASGQAAKLFVPNFVGQSFQAVQEAFLRLSEEKRLELTVVRIDVATPLDPSDDGRVIAIEPAPTTYVGFGALIRLYVGS